MMEARYANYAALKEERGLTDYRVAKESGVSTSSLSAWKLGQHQPDYKNLLRLAQYFDVPVEHFSLPLHETDSTAPAAVAGTNRALTTFSPRALHVAYTYDHADTLTRALIDRVISTQPLAESTAQQ